MENLNDIDQIKFPGDFIGYVQEPYQLVGVVSHIGTSIQNGHYVFAESKENGYTVFNDNKIRDSVIVPGQPYVYLYKLT